ncbi:hypothetical protein [Nostoc sp.]
MPSRDRTLISAIALTNYDRLTNYPTASTRIKRSHFDLALIVPL